MRNRKKDLINKRESEFERTARKRRGKGKKGLAQ